MHSILFFDPRSYKDTCRSWTILKAIVSHTHTHTHKNEFINLAENG